MRGLKPKCNGSMAQQLPEKGDGGGGGDRPCVLGLKGKGGFRYKETEQGSFLM